MPDFLKPYHNKENISYVYTTFTSLLIQKEIYLQKASYATYKHMLHYITLHYTFVQSMSYSHIIDYLGKQYARFNEHKYA